MQAKGSFISDEFIMFLCERAAMCVQGNLNANKDFQAIIKKNYGLVEPHIEQSIRTLASPSFLEKPIIITLESAKIKALFLWMMKYGNDEVNCPTSVLQKMNSVIKKKMDSILSKCADGVARAANAAEDECFSGASAEVFSSLNGILNELSLHSMHMWIKYLLAARSNDKDGTIQALRRYFADIKLLYLHAWSLTKSQKQDYLNFLTNNDFPKEADSSSRNPTCEVLTQEMAALKQNDYTSFIRKCDSCADDKRLVSVGMRDDSDEEEGERTWFAFSLTHAIRGLYEANPDGSGFIYGGDFFKPGLSKSETVDINRAFQCGLENLFPYAEAMYDIEKLEQLPHGNVEDILFEYLNQNFWYLKTLKRTSEQGMTMMRQLVLQTWILQRSGKQVVIDRQAQSRVENIQKDVTELQARNKTLQQENDDLRAKYFGLIKKCNYLTGQLEAKDIAALERAEKQDSGEIGVDIQELENTEIEPEENASSEQDTCDWIAKCNDMIQGKSIFIIGGNENLLKNIAKALPEINIIDKHRSTSVDDAISHADFVFFRYSSLTHSNYWRIRNLCRSWNVPYDYLSNYTAVHLLARDMCLKMEKNGGNKL